MTATATTLRNAQAQRLCQEACSRLHAHDPVEAIALLEQALRLDPHSAQCLSLYGLCLARVHGDYERALRACRQALHEAPDDVDVRTNLGRVYRLMGDKGKAHRLFMDAWMRDRRHPAPAAELTRMGVRHAPVLPFLPRSHWCNRVLGRIRHRLRRALSRAAA